LGDRPAAKGSSPENHTAPGSISAGAALALPARPARPAKNASALRALDSRLSAQIYMRVILICIYDRI